MGAWCLAAELNFFEYTRYSVREAVLQFSVSSAWGCSSYFPPTFPKCISKIRLKNHPQLTISFLNKLQLLSVAFKTEHNLVPFSWYHWLIRMVSSSVRFLGRGSAPL